MRGVVVCICVSCVFMGQRFVYFNAFGSTTKGASVEYLMLPREKRVVKELDKKYKKEHGYPAKWNDDLIYYLGDNPAWAATWSAKSGKIPTYRRNSGLYLHRKSMKFLSGQDKMASLGWPVTNEIGSHMGTGKAVPILDAARAHFLAGNAMHLSNVSLVLLVGLVAFKPTDKF